MNCVDSLNVLTVGERNLNGCLRIINYIQLCSWLECNLDLPEIYFVFELKLSWYSVIQYDVQYYQWSLHLMKIKYHVNISKWKQWFIEQGT